MAIYDLFEYSFAHQVVKEIPEALKVLNEFEAKLYKFYHYKDIGILLDNMKESRIFLSIHLEYYEKILKTKGKLKE